MSIDGQDGRFLEIVGTTRECPNTTQRPLTTGRQILGYVYCSKLKNNSSVCTATCIWPAQSKKGRVTWFPQGESEVRRVEGEALKYG